jgi:hypothetical protein
LKEAQSEDTEKDEEEEEAMTYSERINSELWERSGGYRSIMQPWEGWDKGRT